LGVLPFVFSDPKLLILFTLLGLPLPLSVGLGTFSFESDLPRGTRCWSARFMSKYEPLRRLFRAAVFM
jgi:hypothetical protein